MSVNEFKIAHLTNEQKNKLEQYENEFGFTLIAYEHRDEHPSKSNDQHKQQK